MKIYNPLPLQCLQAVATNLVKAGALGQVRFPSDELIASSIRQDRYPWRDSSPEPTQEMLDEARVFLREQQVVMEDYTGVFSSPIERREVLLAKLYDEEPAALIALEQQDPLLLGDKGELTNDIIDIALDGHELALSYVLEKCQDDVIAFQMFIGRLHINDNRHLNDVLASMVLPIDVYELLTTQPLNEPDNSNVDSLVNNVFVLSALGNEEAFVVLLESALHHESARTAVVDLGRQEEQYDLIDRAVSYFVERSQQEPAAFFGLACIVKADFLLASVDNARQFLLESLYKDGGARDAVARYFRVLPEGLQLFHTIKSLQANNQFVQHRPVDGLLPRGDVSEIIFLAMRLTALQEAKPLVRGWIVEEAIRSHDVCCLIASGIIGEQDEALRGYFYDLSQNPVLALLVLIMRERGCSLPIDNQTPEIQAEYFEGLQGRVFCHALKDPSFMALMMQLYLWDLTAYPALEIRKMMSQGFKNFSEQVHSFVANKKTSQQVFWLSVMVDETSSDFMNRRGVFDQDLDTQRQFIKDLVSLYACHEEAFLDYFYDKIDRKMGPANVLRIRFALLLYVEDPDFIKETGLTILASERVGSLVDQVVNYLNTGRHRLLDPSDSEMLQLRAYQVLDFMAQEGCVEAQSKLTQFKEQNPLKVYELLTLAASMGSAISE
jgi:hypothetical protein